MDLMFTELEQTSRKLFGGKSCVLLIIVFPISQQITTFSFEIFLFPFLINFYFHLKIKKLLFSYRGVLLLFKQAIYFI